jgi:hypothetical protein
MNKMRAVANLPSEGKFAGWGKLRTSGRET